MKDLGVVNKKITVLIHNPEYFTIGQVYRLAELIDMNELALLTMI